MAVSGVGSSSSSGSTAGLNGSSGSLAGNFDTFLNMLVTQLKNQNPLDPLDTNAFTQQLVQFSGVEQQLKTNEFLSAMMQATQSGSNSQAVSYVGKMVTADGTTSQLSNGAATWHFALPKAANITATVYDAKGNVVFTKQGSVAQGESVFTWDGVGSDGKTKPDGAYTIKVSAKDSDGKTVAVSTQMSGEVTGVDFTGTEPVLLLGTGRVTLSSVLKVESKSSSSSTTS